MDKENIDEKQKLELRKNINQYIAVPLSKERKHSNTWGNFSLAKTESTNALDDKNCYDEYFRK